MERERKFRFVGDQRNLKPHFETGVEYFSSFKLPGANFGVLELVENFPDDWEEVTEHEPTRIPNQDQPASSMTKFEMAVFMAMQGLNANPEYFDYDTKDLVDQAITQVTETFKQLSECQE